MVCIIMNALRQVLGPQNGQLIIDLPKEYQQKRFEVIVLPIDDTDIKTQIHIKMDTFLATLPSDETELSNAEILAEIKAVRTARYAQ